MPPNADASLHEQLQPLLNVKLATTVGEPAHPEIGSARVFSEGMGWMPHITAAIFPTNVGDYCIRMLNLDLEGRYKRVFGIHENAVHFSLQL